MLLIVLCTQDKSDQSWRGGNMCTYLCSSGNQQHCNGNEVTFTCKHQCRNSLHNNNNNITQPISSNSFVIKMPALKIWSEWQKCHRLFLVIDVGSMVEQLNHMYLVWSLSMLTTNNKQSAISNKQQTPCMGNKLIMNTERLTSVWTTTTDDS